MLSEFAEVFATKVWRVQVVHLHNAVHELSSLSRCFQLWTNVDKDFFRYLWYCGKKKQIECRLAWNWGNSTDLGLIYMFFTNQNAKFVAWILYHSENRVTSRIWKELPNMVFPPIWGGKWRRSEHAHASYPGLSVRLPGFSPYIGREERRVQGLD